MTPASFATSPAARGDQRKFINPTAGWQGANVFGPDGKPTAIAVEPGGEVWLTPAEERMTAEAPRRPEDNPFVKEWEETVETDPFGEPTKTVTRHGVLVLADEPARPTASTRFIPPRLQEHPAEPGSEREAVEHPADGTWSPEITGTETPAQPPVQGHAAEGEVLGTPEAPAANDEALASRAPTPEQPVRRRRPASDSG
jgi:hypothetical protein